VHLVVIANLFNQTQLHQKFDIKGSRLGRSAGPEAKQQVSQILPHTLTLNKPQRHTLQAKKPRSR
jgi:hypothetical protein